MQITITGKQLRLGDNMQAYAEKNLSAVVEKYFDDAVNASALFSKEGDLIKAEVSVHPASGSLLKGSAQGADAYVAFDQACERIASQLRKYKNRLTEHKNEKFEMVDVSVTGFATGVFKCSNSSKSSPYFRYFTNLIFLCI